MATKRELKAEIITLRKRFDELAARVAALESARWNAPLVEDDGRWRNPWTYPVVTYVEHGLRTTSG